MLAARAALAALALGLGARLPAQTNAPAELRARAEAAYRAGDFAAAGRLFAEALAQPDAPAGPLLYALGNCAYRQGRLADALHAYRRAMLRLPRDRRVAFNASLAERALGAERPAPTLASTLLSPLARATPRELLVAAVLVQALALAAAVLLRRRPRARLAALLAAGTGVLLWAWVAHVRWLAPTEAIVLAPRTPLRAHAGTDARTLSTAQAGDTVLVVAREGEWVHVSHTDGRGWVELSSVGLVD